MKKPNHWKFDSYLQMKPLRLYPCQDKKNLYHFKRIVVGRELGSRAVEEYNHILPCSVGSRHKFYEYASNGFANVKFQRTEAGFLYIQNIRRFTSPYSNRDKVVTPDVLRALILRRLKSFPSLIMKDKQPLDEQPGPSSKRFPNGVFITPIIRPAVAHVLITKIDSNILASPQPLIIRKLQPPVQIPATPVQIPAMPVQIPATHELTTPRPPVHFPDPPVQIPVKPELTTPKPPVQIPDPPMQLFFTRSTSTTCADSFSRSTCPFTTCG
ncbi:hypothetical protein TNCV_2827871 [Trichonephila clavipes]|nr:hypothetical protein TNCV_2827871 [Trichonephila clavipes]